MIDREKVIAGFEDSLANNGCGFMDGIGELFAVSGEDLQNAIALLKAQEPRVMTMDEVINSKSAFWLEFLQEDNDDYYRYGWAFFSGSMPDVIEIIARDSFRPLYAFIAHEYGARWRCWTSRPDEKVRQKTPWE